MSIAEQQAEWMRLHYVWKDKLREVEEKIEKANRDGLNGREIYDYQYREAVRQIALCYELATDRGY